MQRHGTGLQVDLDGQTYHVDLLPWAGTTHVIAIVDGTPSWAVVTRSGTSVAVLLGADRYEFDIARARSVPRHRPGEGVRASRRDISAPMPGLVVSTAVTPGDAIEQGRAVAVMEAMKMQMEIRAPVSGTVVAVPARAGEEVARGTVLVTIETA